MFPWVLSDYESPALDLGSAAGFRDLSKPVGALHSARLERLRARFRDMAGDPEVSSCLLFGAVKLLRTTAAAAPQQAQLMASLPALVTSCQRLSRLWMLRGLNACEHASATWLATQR